MNSIMQNGKSRIMTIFLLTLLLIATNAYAELRTNMSADVVIGQPDFTSNTADQGGAATGNTIDYSKGIYSDGTRLIFGDGDNNRYLIYNTIPTSNNASADVVVGQPDLTSTGSDQGGAAAANTIDEAYDVTSDGTRLIVADRTNERVLIYNTIPTANNASADVVVGQPDFASTNDNQGGGPAANTLIHPYAVHTDGIRLFIADKNNHRVLIYNSIPTSNNASADVVVGQPDFTSNTANQGGAVAANTLNNPYGVFSDGERLFISDYGNDRLLIYNSIPTSNDASADVVVGQPDFTSSGSNQGGTVRPFTLDGPTGIFSDRKRLILCDRLNDRVLVFNNIPTSNNASADIAIGQPDLTSNGANQGGNPAANTLNSPYGICTDGKRLFIGDQTNHRVLIYNIGGSSMELGPQFEQGKAVLGKVFNDINENGWQDKGELGIEGVKVASDTGIYAITDEDGKYHFPSIETGQRLLKIDPATLPEGSVITTESPKRIIATKGILTKVSFGVKLPPEAEPQEQTTEEGPLLKVSVSQDPVLLKPRLQVSAKQIEDKIVFNIDTNYFLFIERADLYIYDKNYKKIKTLLLEKPLPSKYEMKIEDLPDKEGIYYYQLSVYDKKGRQNRTGLGTLQIK